MRDVIEVSYTGDILAYRRCPRSWLYEKHAGFHPYEQVQAMEGRLIHHAMEWLAKEYRRSGHHPPVARLRTQLERQFRVLWARGIRTGFVPKQNILKRVEKNLYPTERIDPTIRTAIEGSQHTEYELRTVKKILPGVFSGKSKLMLTGILDIVIQQEVPLTYERSWEWTSEKDLEGFVSAKRIVAAAGDLEIWDYKGTRASTPYLNDYARQLLTYADLYRERTGTLPVRCAMFFVNEPNSSARLVAIPINEEIIQAALKWTLEQVRDLRAATVRFESNPLSIQGGSVQLAGNPEGRRVDGELKKQCTACGERFDCQEYISYRGGPYDNDVRRDNVQKN